MNWDAIGAISDLVGAFAVVVSILYVSKQVKDAAASARRTANHDLLEASNPAFIALAADEKLAGVWARGMVDFGALTPVERIRYSAILLNIVYMWEEAYHAAEGGHVDAFAFARTEGSRAELLAMPGFRAWWNLRSSWVGPEFRSFIDAQIRDAVEVSPMYRAPKVPDVG